MNELAPASSRRRGTRCPTCGARVTSSTTWCSLCFTDLAPPAASVDAVAPATEGADAATAPLAASVDAVALATEGADAGGEAERLAEQMLAQLAATSTAPARRTPDLFGTSGGRAVAMVLGTILVGGLGFALLALAGTMV